MNLQEYTAAAIQTESRLPAFVTDATRLVNVLQAVIAAGNLLDVIKKDTYYGLPKDATKYAQREQRLAINTQLLNDANTNVQLSSATAPVAIPQVDPRLAHAIIGLATESVELLEALWQSIHSGQPIDGVNILEELGDLNWYHAIAIDALGGDWEKVQETNIAKLRARNKGATFNAEATINRDVEAERGLLEQKLS